MKKYSLRELSRHLLLKLYLRIFHDIESLANETIAQQMFSI